MHLQSLHEEFGLDHSSLASFEIESVVAGAAFLANALQHRIDFVK